MERGLGGTLAGRSLDEMMAAWGRAKLAEREPEEGPEEDPEEETDARAATEETSE